MGRTAFPSHRKKRKMISALMEHDNFQEISSASPDYMGQQQRINHCYPFGMYGTIIHRRYLYVFGGERIGERRIGVRLKRAGSHGKVRWVVSHKTFRLRCCWCCFRLKSKLFLISRNARTLSHSSFVEVGFIPC